jgi:hypothetical protein
MHETVPDQGRGEILEFETVYSGGAGSDFLEITTSGPCLFSPDGLRGVVARMNAWLVSKGRKGEAIASARLGLIPTNERLFLHSIAYMIVCGDKSGRRVVFDTHPEPCALDRDDVKEVVEQLQEWLHVTAVEAGEEADDGRVS